MVLYGIKHYICTRISNEAISIKPNKMRTKTEMTNTNIDDVLTLTSATKKHVANVEKRFYDVVKVPLVPADPRFKASDSVFGIYKGTGELLSRKPLGVDFLPMQQSEFLNSILYTFSQFGANLDLNTLSFNEYCGGSKIEFRIKTNPFEFVNPKKLKDITELEIVFSTSYDGSKSNKIGLFTRRLVCLNGMTVANLEGELKGRNTLGGKTKILSYCEELANILNATENWKQKMLQLSKRKLSVKEIEAFKLQLFGFNKETLKAKETEAMEQGKSDAQIEQKVGKQNEMLKNIEESIALEFQRTGVTAFGLLQGITHYTNHKGNDVKHIASKTEISNDEYIRYYRGAEINNDAQRLVLELIAN